jgi:REP element-mobilizing transposase RayT
MSYYERTLPHWQPEGRDLFLTWRLSGSLPAAVMADLRARKTETAGLRFREYDRELDSGSCGPRWLEQPQIASLVASELEKVAASGLCRVYAWVVMPNHVHLLIEPRVQMRFITKAIKGPTARCANLLLGRTGTYFWQDECFDHWIRNGAEFEKIKNYIEQNPVRARLARDSAQWPWSSANGRVFGVPAVAPDAPKPAEVNSASIRK